LRFWDSSALVPLIVQQSASSEVERWLDEDTAVVVWTLTPIEVTSALRRLVREGSLPERAARDAEALLDDWLGRVHVVADVERVKAIARRMLRVHALRSADALQLAAALAWAGGSPQDQMLHTFDRRLGIAAEREGFRVVPDA
jgi:hypothetical protein